MTTELFNFPGRPGRAVGLALALAVSGAAVGLAQAIPAFSDQTDAAGVTFFSGVLGDTPGFPMHGGITEIDYNNDGWPDLFVVGGGGKHDRLYRNNGNGTFTDVAGSAGLNDLYRGNGTNAGDYNKDGCIDLFVVSHGDVPGVPVNGQHKLYRNNCDGTFTNVAVVAGVNSTGSYPDGYGTAWGDYNMDGWLDLWVGSWHDDGTGYAANNKLFKNNGDGTFTDVTAALGLFTENTQGFGAIFADMNGDRWPELLVAGDFGTSRYYGNRRRDRGLREMGILSPGDTKVHNGMGTTIADYDRDGDQDWFITAIYPAWLNEGPPGNRLYMNNGGHQFSSLPQSSGVNDGGWGWGAASQDFDHDGWVDIIHTNGWFNCPDPVTGECFVNEPTYLFKNDGPTGAGGELMFHETAIAWGLENRLQGRGLVTFDYDRDGDMDVVVSSNWNAGPGDPPNTGDLKLYRNDLSGTGINWLKVKLDSSANPALPPNGLGANVRVSRGGAVQNWRLNGGSNYLSRSEVVAHFGLGTTDRLDEVRIDWADGFRTSVRNVAANQEITLAAPLPLTHNALVRGQMGTFTLVGLQPGETAVFGVSTTGSGSGPCFPVLDGMCTDLLAPQILGSAVADANGTAVLSAMVDAGWPDAVWFQVLVQRGPQGVTSVKSNVAAAAILNMAR